MEKLSSSQSRLLISGTAMFLFFGLIPSLPPVHFNKELFPGTRHMYTLHMEATLNGFMLIILALLVPILKLNRYVSFFYEVSAHIGAWCNIFPWLLGAYTGAVFIMGQGQQSGNHLAVPPSNNEEIVFIIHVMLGCCAVGDILAWTIVFAALLSHALSKEKLDKKQK